MTKEQFMEKWVDVNKGCAGWKQIERDLDAVLEKTRKEALIEASDEAYRNGLPKRYADKLRNIQKILGIKGGVI